MQHRRLLQDGTAQAGSTLPIVYGEYGVQTEIPAAQAASYTGSALLDVGAADEATQARYYVEAIRLAACQPNVRMLLFFHVFDEPQLAGLQTGVYYADLQPKSSLDPVAAAARAAAAGKVQCSS